MLRNHNHRRSAFTIFVILILTLVLGCQNRTPEAMTLRVHIIDGLSESKTVMPDGFRGIDRYELFVVDNGGMEVAKAMTNSSVDAVVDGIAPGSYTFAVKGYTTIGGVEHLIVDDNESVTVKDGMSEVSVAVSDVAAGTGAVSVTITAEIPDGYTFADDVVTVRLYEGVNGGVAAYETTVGYSVNGGTMTAEWVSDGVETGIYTLEVQADELFGKTALYVLPGMMAKGSVEVNPMVAEKVATPVISEVESKNSTLQSKAGDPVGDTAPGISGVVEIDIDPLTFTVVGDFSINPYLINAASFEQIFFLDYELNVISTEKTDNSFWAGGNYYEFTDGEIKSIKNTPVIYFRVIYNGIAYTSPAIVNAEYNPLYMLNVSCTTADSVIYYTVDGSVPNQSSELYSGPIEVEVGTTVKARAFKDGMLPSEIVSYEVFGPAYDVSFSGDFRSRELCDKEGNGLGATGTYHSGETVYFCYFLGGNGCSIEIIDSYGIKINSSEIGDTADNYRIGSFSMPNSAVEININMIEIG